MAQNEYTKQELLDLLKKHIVNGKVSYDSFAEIVFDPKFPEALFENAKEGLKMAWEDENRFKFLANSLAEKYQSGVETQEKIIELKQELSTLEHEIKTLEKEFYEIQNRIAERRGK